MNARGLKIPKIQETRGLLAGGRVSGRSTGSSIRPSPASPSPVPARPGEGRGGSSARDRGYAPAEDRQQLLSYSLPEGGSGGRLRVVVIFRFALTSFVLLVLHLAGHHTRRHHPPDRLARFHSGRDPAGDGGPFRTSNVYSRYDPSTS